MSRLSKRVAFTLIEMLVVIAVIMTLAALLLPALSRAKEGGRAAKCASNLHHLQVAVLNYMGTDKLLDGGSLPQAVSSWSDNKDGTWSRSRGWVDWGTWTSYPTNGPVSGNPTGTGAWNGTNGIRAITNGTLWEFTESRDVYLCPTFAQRSVCRTNDAVRSYSMNSKATGNFMTAGAFTVILFGDDRTTTNSPYDTQFDAATEIGQWHSTTGRVGAGNVVYLDGHVEKR
jgi:prepilin-type processing-associated H-X9-DG protein